MTAQHMTSPRVRPGTSYHGTQLTLTGSFTGHSRITTARRSCGRHRRPPVIQPMMTNQPIVEAFEVFNEALRHAQEPYTDFAGVQRRRNPEIDQYDAQGRREDYACRARQPAPQYPNRYRVRLLHRP